MIDRILYYFKLILIVIITAYYSIKAILISRVFKRGDFYKLTKDWAHKILRAASINVNVEGSEKIEKGISYIYASNHSSLFDIPVMLATIEDNVRIIYKKELEKVPFFGPGLKYGPFISIDRSDPRKSMQSIEEAAESIRSGDSVIIYPEGTRSKDGNLQEFKRGAFMLASRAGNPIVPISISGTHDILPSGRKYFRKGKVRFVYHDPVENNTNNKFEEQDLMKRVHEIIASGLEK